MQICFILISLYHSNVAFVTPIHSYFTPAFISDSWGCKKNYFPALFCGLKRLRNTGLSRYCSFSPSPRESIRCMQTAAALCTLVFHKVQQICVVPLFIEFCQVHSVPVQSNCGLQYPSRSVTCKNGIQCYSVVIHDADNSKNFLSNIKWALYHYRKRSPCYNEHNVFVITCLISNRRSFILCMQPFLFSLSPSILLRRTSNNSNELTNQMHQLTL